MFFTSSRDGLSTDRLAPDATQRHWAARRQLPQVPLVQPMQDLHDFEQWMRRAALYEGADQYLVLSISYGVFLGDILERLHLDDGRKFRSKLLGVGIPYVSKFSFYSNQRATGKVRA